MEITKMMLEFLAENPWKSFFFLLAFRPFKLISIDKWSKDK